MMAAPFGPLRGDTRVSTSRRDPALDQIRGLCILSMIIGHLADRSPLYAVTHEWIWVDGATGFVLLAGLVIGMVQSRTERPTTALLMLARRARLIWLAQVGIVLFALLLAPWDQMLPIATPSADRIGGWGSALWQTATLRLNPIDADILSLYVVLFAAAAAAVLLLRIRLPWVVVTVSLAGYAWGLANPSAAALPRYAGGPGSHFDVAAWQAIFVLALVAGWYWRTPRVQRFLADRRVALGAGGVILASVLAYQLVERIGVLASVPGIEATVRAAFAKSAVGPGRMLLGACVLVLLYHALRSARLEPITAAVRPLLGPIGRHALGAYLILTGVDLALQSLAPYQPETFVGMQWAAVVVVIAWAWSRHADRRRARARGGPQLPARTGVDAPAGDPAGAASPWDELPAVMRRASGVG